MSTTIKIKSSHKDPNRPQKVTTLTTLRINTQSDAETESLVDTIQGYCDKHKITWEFG